MTKNIILAGVGGQGILTIAAIIDQAAMFNNLFIKQAEVHGMSQRGGAVQSHLRISDTEIYSDLISMGTADMIISLEPMEALRYMPFLSDKGTIITATKPFINIGNYPDENKVIDEIKNSGTNYQLLDIESLAQKAGNLRTRNVVMVGAAYKYLGIPQDLLEKSIRQLFAAKGDEIVSQNLKAFKLGLGANA
jgi:indolepyruvate ferredoxin oxidoreductase beta subunit